MQETKVVKFGGSSLADANQFRKVADIILAEESRRFVVASAPGKRFSDDIKVTDMLYSCYEKASNGEDFEAEFSAIKERYGATFFPNTNEQPKVDIPEDKATFNQPTKPKEDIKITRNTKISNLIIK